MKPELTYSQSLLLMKICEHPMYASDGYLYAQRAQRLIRRGYAEFRGNILHPTQAGRAALVKAKEDVRTPVPPPDESLAAFEEWWNNYRTDPTGPFLNAMEFSKVAWDAALAWHKSKTKE